MTNQSPRTVLIVDDSLEDRVAYKRYFVRAENQRHVILEAASAAEGLALWKTHRPDCVLLDHQLPDRDGLAVLHAIVAECGEAACAVVMLTGMGDTQLAVEAMKAGAHDYLDKSNVTAELLLRTVNNAVEKAALRRQLDEQREWLRVTLSSIGDAVIATDTAGRVVFLNPVAVTLTGWSPEDAKGRSATEIFHIVHEETRATVESPIERALREGEVVGLGNQTILLSKDGREIPIDDSSAPIRDETGTLRGAVLVFRDNTERRQAEAKREELLRKESEARAVAEAANRSKDEFLAVVSHELRSPLNAILGYTHLVRRNPNNPTQVAQYSEIIERNAKVQLKLIEDLLDTARVVTGKLKIELAPIDLRLVLQDALTVVRPAAEAKRIELVARIDNESQQILGDGARLQQVAWNLLQNAIKFTPEGGRVELHLKQDGQHAHLIVSDTGKGLEPAFLSAVFDRFSQHDMSSTRRHGGLGLGLALVKQLVELHGGRIEVMSDGIDRGATFTVRLPLRPPLVATPLTQPRFAAEIDNGLTTHKFDGLPRLNGVRVLVVDDQEDARLLVAELLSVGGAVVQTVASGLQVEALLANATYDVLVCDIAMPDIDGFEVLRRLRAYERQHDVPLSQRLPAIALTAQAQPEDRTRILKAGFQTHVAKPVEPAELIMVIANLMETRRTSRAVS